VSLSENLLVGVVALALVPLIARRILRGVRDGRLPVYRTYVRREEDRGKFTMMLALHILSLLLVAFVAADLLLGLRQAP
jgi:hypothetical protein